MASKYSRSGVGGGKTVAPAEGPLQILTDARVVRSGEKKELTILNDRFGSYIDKVRTLQERNYKLQAQVTIQEAKAGECSTVSQVYEAELKELRALVDQLTQERNQQEAEKNSWQAQAVEWQGKCEAEKAATEAVRAEITATKTAVDAATVERVGFENKLTTALEEVEFLKRMFAEQTQKLQGQVNQAIAIVETDHPVFTGPDLTDTLAEIRQQYEIVGRINREEAAAKYKQKFSEMAEQRERDNEALAAARAELASLRRQQQTLIGQIEALKSTAIGWEGSIAEAEAKAQAEMAEYKVAIREFELQIEKMKVEMSQHTVEYQELMTIKAALDVEITAYKKLLEGEEMRLLQGLIK